MDFVADFAQGLIAPANEKHARAQRRKMQGHGAPEARATAAQKNRTTLEQVLLKHGSPPVVSFDGLECSGILVYWESNSVNFGEVLPTIRNTGIYLML